MRKLQILCSRKQKGRYSHIFFSNKKHCQMNFRSALFFVLELENTLRNICFLLQEIPKIYNLIKFGENNQWFENNKKIILGIIKRFTYF